MLDGAIAAAESLVHFQAYSRRKEVNQANGGGEPPISLENKEQQKSTARWNDWDAPGTSRRDGHHPRSGYEEKKNAFTP